jgi:Mce-associated membrane protein
VPVLAALLVVLLGLTGFLGWKAYDTAGAPSVEGSRTAALASSRDAARAVFSYDYRHLDKDFTAGKAVTTGTFAEQYATTTAKLLDFAVKNKATVVADVSDASVVRASDDEVVCLVFLNQTSSSSAVETPRITQSRLEMTMKRRGGSWLVASINAL